MPDSEELDESEPDSAAGTDTAAPNLGSPAPQVPWPRFLKAASEPQIKERFAAESAAILGRYELGKYSCLALFESEGEIDSYDLDRIFGALRRSNETREKDVVLFLLSRGGSVEPAYQISKLCKIFAKSKFIAAVPRFAKSAATLIALGADEIHMGLLGELGPIDPQLGGLPALGVSQALRTIASVSSSYPKSADMFAKYLRQALTVEQIGYCDRVSESATQYAERLLLTKPSLQLRAKSIAKELVHEYKHHGFVIDLDEAQQHLGSEWIKTDTEELRAAEEFYDHFKWVNFLLGFKNKSLLVIGAPTESDSVVLLTSDPVRKS